ncbi:MAG: tetratricopeptide repeat protein [Vulcanimicrobiota bacterium]
MKNFKRFYVLIIFLLITVIISAYAQETPATDVQQLLDEGDSLILQKEYGQALEKYSQALEKAHQNPDCHYKIGVANYFLKNYDEAINAYKKTIEIEPDYYKALNNLGLIYQKQDNNIEATMLYKEALKVNPGYRKARYNLGVILYKRDKLSRAGEVAKALTGKYPGYDKGYYLLGLIYESQKNYVEAREAYEKALELKQNNTVASDALKRINSREKISEMFKRDLAEAQKIVNFKLPPEYEFKRVINLSAGLDVIYVTYQDEQDLYLVKFPDYHVLEDKDIKTLLLEPNQEFKDFLEQMKLQEVTLLDIRRFQKQDEPGENSGESLEIEKSNDYALIDLSRDGEKSRAVMSLLKPIGADSQILFVAISPGDVIITSSAEKFLGSVGRSSKTDNKPALKDNSLEETTKIEKPDSDNKEPEIIEDKIQDEE